MSGKNATTVEQAPVTESECDKKRRAHAVMQKMIALCNNDAPTTPEQIDSFFHRIFDAANDHRFPKDTIQAGTDSQCQSAVDRWFPIDRFCIGKHPYGLWAELSADNNTLQYYYCDFWHSRPTKYSR
jgi:hypothetical protein